MTVEYLDLTDYLAIAAEVTGLDVTTLTKVTRPKATVIVPPAGALTEPDPRTSAKSPRPVPSTTAVAALSPAAS